MLGRKPSRSPPARRRQSPATGNFSKKSSSPPSRRNQQSPAKGRQIPEPLKTKARKSSSSSDSERSPPPARAAKPVAVR